VESSCECGNESSDFIKCTLYSVNVRVISELQRIWKELVAI
jgi:hypothetical protein